MTFGGPCNREADVAGYQFGPQEKVVLRAQDVKVDGNSSFFSSSAELILTNHNIVFPRKGMFGKVKGYHTWPLSSIRMVDGVPQCRLDSSEFMAHKLEVSFNDGLVSFEFGSLDAKKEVRQWVNEICVLLTGVQAPEENLRSTGAGAFADGDSVAETFGGIFGSFESAFNRKMAEAEPEVACRCPSCNASVKGRRGTTVVCPYCESNVTIR